MVVWGVCDSNLVLAGRNGDVELVWSELIVERVGCKLIPRMPMS